MISSKPNYPPMGSPPDAITLRVKISTYKFEEDITVYSMKSSAMKIPYFSFSFSSPPP